MGRDRGRASWGSKEREAALLFFLYLGHCEAGTNDLSGLQRRDGVDDFCGV